DESEDPKPINNRKIGADADGKEGSGDAYGSENKHGEITRALSGVNPAFPSNTEGGAAGFIFRKLDIPNNATIKEASINLTLTGGVKREPSLWRNFDWKLKGYYYSSEHIDNFKPTEGGNTLIA